MHSGKIPRFNKSSKEAEPVLLDNFLWFSSVIGGQCIYVGISQPKTSFNLLYLEVLDKYSFPLTICVISIKWSSITFAKLYVG